MDVIGLYINVKPKRVGEEVTECIKESNWKCEVNTDELGKFITLLIKRDKIKALGLHECTPNVRDPTKIPDLLSGEVQKNESTEYSKSMWIPPKKKIASRRNHSSKGSSHK